MKIFIFNIVIDYFLGTNEAISDVALGIVVDYKACMYYQLHIEQSR